MIIEFSKDLKRQKIYACGSELIQILGQKADKAKKLSSLNKKLVGIIKNPVLVTDLSAMVKQLKSSVVRDSVFALYQSYPRITQYCGVSVWWNPQRHRNVWCPTIDTILFAKALNKVFKNSKNFRNVIEIGCGSGFLGKYVAEKCNKIKKIDFVDINPLAILCVKDNSKGLKNVKIKFSTAKWQDVGHDHKYDLIICNPPYLLRPQSIDNNPYEGISLMHDLIVSGKNYLNKDGSLIINYSSLCEKNAKNFIKKSGLEMTPLEKMKVPLKVLPVLNNRQWMKFLYKKSNLRKRLIKNYDFWHTLNIIQLKNE